MDVMLCCVYMYMKIYPYSNKHLTISKFTSLCVSVIRKRLSISTESPSLIGKISAGYECIFQNGVFTFTTDQRDIDGFMFWFFNKECIKTLRELCLFSNVLPDVTSRGGLGEVALGHPRPRHVAWRLGNLVDWPWVAASV